MVEPLRPEVTLGVRGGAVWAFVFGQCPLPVAGRAAPRTKTPNYPNLQSVTEARDV